MYEQTYELRRKRKVVKRVAWKRVLILVMVATLLFLLAFCGGMYFYLKAFQPKSSEPTNIAGVDPREGERTNILVLGVDDGDAEVKDSPTRSDTMILVSIDPKENSISLLSIPRDTRVHIPGRDGFDKITHAHAYGGAKLSVQTVQEFLDVPINYYVEVSWKAFQEMIDILGGIDYNVEQRMYYYDPYEDLEIDLQPGMQYLDGRKAGEYVRYRGEDGDIGRVERQQKFLEAVADKLFQSGTILRLPTLATTLSKYVKTNMDPEDLFRLAGVLTKLDRQKIYMEMVPGTDPYIDGVSYWEPDLQATQALVDRLIRGEGDGSDQSFVSNETGGTTAPEGTKQSGTKQSITSGQTTPGGNAGKIRVEVLNGTGTPGLANQVAEKLRQQGFDVVEVGNADNFNYRLTQVIDRAGMITTAQKVAKVVKSAELIQEIDRSRGVDVTVVIGKDYD